MERKRERKKEREKEREEERRDKVLSVYSRLIRNALLALFIDWACIVPDSVPVDVHYAYTTSQLIHCILSEFLLSYHAVAA